LLFNKLIKFKNNCGCWIDRIPKCREIIIISKCKIIKITRWFPKIAPYPFTTLYPHIGVINFSDGLRIKMADLPGKNNKD